MRISVLTTLATAVLGLALPVRRDPAAFIGHPAMLVALALLLGLDNFAAGVTGAAAGLAALAATGFVSGALALIACFASSGSVHLIARRSVPLASPVMLAALAATGLA